MKINPIVRVIGVRIELDLDEALKIAQHPVEGKTRVIEEVRAALTSSGVDPDTGEPRESALGLKPLMGDELNRDDLMKRGKATIPVDPGPFRRLDGSHPSKDEQRGNTECPYCGKVLKTPRGLKVHVSRIHKARVVEDEIEQMERESL
jgi:hypothetical protein